MDEGLQGVAGIEGIRYVCVFAFHKGMPYISESVVAMKDAMRNRLSPHLFRVPFVVVGLEDATASRSGNYARPNLADPALFLKLCFCKLVFPSQCKTRVQPSLAQRSPPVCSTAQTWN